MEKINERTMINEHYIPEAVILANGEYPTHPLPLRMLEEAKFVVCCDGVSLCSFLSPVLVYHETKFHKSKIL